CNRCCRLQSTLSFRNIRFNTSLTGDVPDHLADLSPTVRVSPGNFAVSPQCQIKIPKNELRRNCHALFQIESIVCSFLNYSLQTIGPDSTHADERSVGRHTAQTDSWSSWPLGRGRHP